MSGLEIRLLGAPQIELDGRIVTFERHKTLALCALLAVNGTQLARDFLATLLWPEQDQSRARASLRRALAELTKNLGPDYLRTEREALGFLPDAPIHSDTSEFQTILTGIDFQQPPASLSTESLNSLVRAVSLYRGDFLSGFTLRDAPEFDAWQFQTSDRFNAAAIRALDTLIIAQESHGALSLAIDHAQHLLALDPLDERAHCHLIRLHAVTGGRTQAMRQFERCRELLDSELGVPPAPATLALFEQVCQGALEPVSPSMTGSYGDGKDRMVSGLAPATPSPRPPERQDRIRNVTVLSLGVIAEDNSGESDLTDYAQLLRSFVSKAHAAGQSLGATFEHLYSDGGLCFFGAEQSHEDDPERALNFAFVLHNLAQEHDLHYAIGIKTGPVYILGSRQEQTPAPVIAGPIISQAATLQRGAESDEILIDRNTCRLVREAFAVAPIHEPDGPAAAYRVLHPLPEPHKSRGIRSLTAPMIGRDAELAQLVNACALARNGEGQVAVIAGEAGVGKSRLVSELRHAVAKPEQAEALRWLEGRCLEMSTAAGYWPYREILRAFFGWRFEEQRDAFAARIRTRLQSMERRGSLTAAQAEEIGPVIGNLLSVDFGTEWDDRFAVMSAAQVRHRTLTALAEFIPALARERPLVLVLEDLQWSDELTIDLTIRLMESVAEIPLLLLCVHRPVPDERIGNLTAAAARKYPGHVHEIRLRELSPVQIRALVRALLMVEDLESGTRAWILERGQGNPFFTEEVIRSLIDSGSIQRDGDTWRSHDSMAPGTELVEMVPQSVDSLIQARVDRLDRAERRLLQMMAVAGRTVELPVLQELAADPEGLATALQALEAQGYLYLERTVPWREYSFHHVLTREAVYRTIPDERCRTQHHATAAAIERVFAATLPEQTERLAYHYERTDDDEKAAHYLAAAGDRARRAFLNAEAARYYRSALTRLASINRPGVDVRKEVARIGYSLGRVRYAQFAMADAERSLQQAIDTGVAAGVDAHTLARYHFWLGETLYWQERTADVITTAKAGLRLLPKEDRSAAAVMLQGHVACCSAELGDRTTYRTLTSWYSEFLDDVSFCEELSPAYHHAIDAALVGKDPARSAALIETLLDKAMAVNDLVSAAKAYYLRGRNLSVCGHYAAGLAALERARQVAEKTGEMAVLYFALQRLAYDQLALGQERHALTVARAMCAYSEAQPAGIFPAWSDEVIGRTWLAMMRPRDAQRHLSAAIERFQSLDIPFLAEHMLWLGHAHLADGSRDRARECYLDALRRFTPDGEPRPTEPERKSDFAEALAGLEKALFDDDAFRAECAELRIRHADHLGRFRQWYLEPAVPHPVRSNRTDAVTMPPGAGWRWDDPMEDCACRVDSGLIIMAQDGRDIWFTNETAPRFLRPVAGDWTLQVRCSPSAETQPAMGGVLLWRDLRNFVRLDYGAHGPHEISFAGCLAGESMWVGRGRLVSESMWLRMECTGGEICALCSADGQSWFTAGTVELPKVNPWEVGLFAAGLIDRSLYPGVAAGGGAMRFQDFKLWVHDE